MALRFCAMVILLTYIFTWRITELIRLEDWAMIKYLHREGVPVSRIAQELGINRKTVAKVIKDDERPEYKRQSRGSMLDPYKDYIKQRLEKYDLTAPDCYSYLERDKKPGLSWLLYYTQGLCASDKRSKT